MKARRQAAVLDIKLRHLDDWTRGRQKNAALYEHLFLRAGLSGTVTLPYFVTVLRGGTAAMMLGARPGSGMRAALEEPDRVDALFLDRVGIPVIASGGVGSLADLDALRRVERIRPFDRVVRREHQRQVDRPAAGQRLQRPSVWSLGRPIGRWQGFVPR